MSRLVETVVSVAALVAWLPAQSPADFQQIEGWLARAEELAVDRVDVPGAREKVLQASARMAALGVGDDHPRMQVLLWQLGFAAAHADERQLAHDAWARLVLQWVGKVKDEREELRLARAKLAFLKYQLGDHRGSLTLVENVLPQLRRALPDEHPHVQAARLGLATAKGALGDVVGELAAEEEIVEVDSRALGGEHGSVQAARRNVAITLFRLGEHERALALLTDVHDTLGRQLPGDHAVMQGARINLAAVRRALGDLKGARALETTVVEVFSKTLPADHLELQKARRNLALTLRRMGDLKGALALQRKAFEVLLRTVPTGHRDLEAVRRDLLWTHALRGDGAAVRDLASSVPVDGLSLSTLASVTVGCGSLPAQPALAARLLWLHESTRVASPPAAPPNARQLAARLPEGGAAVSVLAYAHRQADPDDRHEWKTEPRLLALCVGHDGAISAVPLAAAADVDPLVAALPAEAGAAAELRRLVVDPILAVLGDGRVVHVSLDGSLQRAPLDALPAADREPVGVHVELRPVVSVFDLLRAPRAKPLGPPRLVAFGGVDHDGPPAEVFHPSLATAAPVLADRPGGAAQVFAPLATVDEVDRIAKLFGERFPDGDAQLWMARAASKAQLFASAPGARYLHLAVRGYFARPWVASARARRDAGAELPWQLDDLRGVRPGALRGLALAGANGPPDAVGRRAGIATAEELARLDLAQCELVVLSHCDGRTGADYADLRAALADAGARAVLTSQWPTREPATRALLIEFYRRLWSDGRDPWAALWAARMAARADGAPFRDWAGWTLTTAP